MVIYLTGKDECLRLMCERTNEGEFVFVFNISDCFLTCECLCLRFTYSSLFHLISFYVLCSLFNLFFLVSLLSLVSLEYKKRESTGKKLRKNRVEGKDSSSSYNQSSLCLPCRLYKYNEELCTIKNKKQTASPV